MIMKRRLDHLPEADWASVYARLLTSRNGVPAPAGVVASVATEIQGGIMINLDEARATVRDILIDEIGDGDRAEMFAAGIVEALFPAATSNAGPTTGLPDPGLTEKRRRGTQ